MVADPHHFIADPDSDPAFTLMRIRIQLFTLLIRIRIQLLFEVMAIWNHWFIDPHLFGCSGTGSILGMRILSRSMENDHNLQINIVSCLLNRLFYLRRYVY
jgi:hypothetical protein